MEKGVKTEAFSGALCDISLPGKRGVGFVNHVVKPFTHPILYYLFWISNFWPSFEN